MGEAGIAMPMYMVVVSLNLAPEADKQNWGAKKAMEIFNSRRTLVTRQLAQAPFMAGDAFTAADISMTYALQFARRSGGWRSPKSSGCTWRAPPRAKVTSAP